MIERIFEGIQLSQVVWCVLFWLVVAIIVLPKKKLEFTYEEPDTLPTGEGVIYAKNYYEACKRAEGITLDGGRYITVTHIGHNLWRIGYQDFDV